jgi:hypothetical protein
MDKQEQTSLVVGLFCIAIGAVLGVCTFTIVHVEALRWAGIVVCIVTLALGALNVFTALRGR